MTRLEALSSLNHGGVIFESEVDRGTIAVLNGMVANSELCRCSHGEFTYWFAWSQKDTESEADKAHQMAKALKAR